MLKFLAMTIILAAPAMPDPNQAPHSSMRPDSASVAVREDGLVATWYPPINGRRGPAVIVLGGSEGGERGAQAIARALAAQGYGALALAYFRAEGLPKTLQNIPLEYFDRGIAWLVRQPLADPARLGIYGVSVGAETALLVATRHREFKAVVATVPSSVVWQGYDPSDYQSVQSTYSLNGKGVSYLAYDTSQPFTGVYALYADTLKTLSRHPDAMIPVEKIGGAILLLSAKADTIWPSSEMSEQVIARLDAHNFPLPYRHVAFPDAGHGAALPPGSGPTRETGYNNLGGTEAGNTAARAVMWRETLTFLDEHLGRGARPGRKAR